jgi:hypothetical protein
MSFKCPSCNSKFTRKRNLTKHFGIKHSNTNVVMNCFLCGQIFSDNNLLDEHHKNYHKPSNYFEIRDSAFQRAALCYRYVYDIQSILTPSEAQSNFVKNEIKKIVFHETAVKNAIKFSIIFIAEMKMLDNMNVVISKAIIPFRSQTFTATPLDKYKINKNIRKAMQDHSDKIETFINNGSNWVFNRAIAMDVEIGGVNPLYMGADLKSLKVDMKNIKNKKHLINVPSKDNKCFLYCIAEALYGYKINNKKHFKNYEKHIRKFDINGISFPVSVSDIKKFVKINPELDIKINLIFLSGEKVYPLECGIGKGSITVNLLSVPIENNDTTYYHFLLIKNLDKYLSKTYTSESKKKYYENAFYCPNCFNKFTKKNARNKHIITCKSQKAQIEKVPDIENSKIYFNKFENQFEQNLIAYLDFECELPKVIDNCEKCNTIRCKCDTSYTRFENEQKPICFAFFIINKENEIVYSKVYSGNNAADVFLDDLLLQEKEWIKIYLNETIKMKKLTEEEEILYEISEKCYICEKEFTPDDPKVRDHDHIEGFFISAAHNSCNLKRRRQSCLKIFMHNGSKYDFHFLVKSLAKRNLNNLYILPYNMEHFRMVKFNSFMLLDSLAFMQSSLAQLAEELKQSNHNYPILKNSEIVKTKGYFDKEKYDMILQKGFFPYEYW